MSSSPVVSVVIPAYNRAHLISRAIASVLNQTYQDFEIIVVDDASSDNIEEIVNSLDDERIRYIRHATNKGAGAARNSGITAAQGIYIALLDSDDEWFPEKLEKQVDRFDLSGEKTGVVYNGHLIVAENTNEIIARNFPTVRGNVYIHALRYCLVGGGSTAMVKRECFQKAGLFDERLPSLEDWELWIRIAKICEFDFIPDILTKRYIHGQQLTTTLKGKIKARREIIKKHYPDLSRYPSILADHLNRLGVLYSYESNLAEARRLFLKSIIKRPVQYFAYVRILPLLIFPGLYKKMLSREIVLKSVDDIPIYW